MELTAGLMKPQPSWWRALEQIPPVRVVLHQAETAGPSCCHLAQSVSESQPGKGVTLSEAVLYQRQTNVVNNCRLFADCAPCS